MPPYEGFKRRASNYHHKKVHNVRPVNTYRSPKWVNRYFKPGNVIKEPFTPGWGNFTITRREPVGNLDGRGWVWGYFDGPQGRPQYPNESPIFSYNHLWDSVGDKIDEDIFQVNVLSKNKQLPPDITTNIKEFVHQKSRRKSRTKTRRKSRTSKKGIRS